MLDVILRQTRLEKDLNGDGFIDFGEYIGPRGDNPNGAVDLERQREMFDAGHDLDGDGLLDADEFKRWVAPSNESVNGSPPPPPPAVDALRRKWADPRRSRRRRATRPF